MIVYAVLTLGISGFVFAVLLAVFDKRLRVKEDPRIEKVLAALPGLNCGACGFSGCKPFAAAVVNEGKIFNGCLPGGAEVNDQITSILGIAGCRGKKHQVVACRCGAQSSEKKVSTDYRGPQTCTAAHVTGGALDCSYGCLAFGDCISVCPVAALSLHEGKIRVDINRCIGCGQCQKVCPRKLYEMVPYKENLHTCSVACSNTEKAQQVRNVCSRGCIACTLCTRGENSPYYMQNNLSFIDYAKANEIATLLAGKNKCPTKCIVELHE